MGSAAIQILKKQKGEAVDDEKEVKAAEPEKPAKKAPAKKAPAKKTAAKKPAAKKAPAKKAPAKKAAPKTATAPTSNDLIVSISEEIENYTQDDAYSTLETLLDNNALDEFRMGGVLAKIQTEGWFGEHPNFRTLIEAEFGLAYRTAMAYVALYKNVVNSELSWDVLKPLGWTKVSILSPILDKDNCEEILKTVDGMNTLQVQEYVREFQKGNATTTEVPADVSELKTKSFKLFPGQKESVEMALEKAMNEAGSESESHALEMICVDFVAGAPVKGKKTKAEAPDPSVPMDESALTAQFTAIREQHDEVQDGLAFVLQVVAEVWPEANLTVELD